MQKEYVIQSNAMEFYIIKIHSVYDAWSLQQVLFEMDKTVSRKIIIRPRIPQGIKVKIRLVCMVAYFCPLHACSMLK